MTYSKKFLVDVAMTNFDYHFAIGIAFNRDADEMSKDKLRLRKSLEDEYCKIGKDHFRKLNGVSSFKIQNFIDKM